MKQLVCVLLAATMSLQAEPPAGGLDEWKKELHKKNFERIPGSESLKKKETRS